MKWSGQARHGNFVPLVPATAASRETLAVIILGMPEFSFKDHNGGYSNRIKKSLVLNFGIAFVLGIVISQFGRWEIGVSVGVVFFIIQFVKSNRWDKYFIEKISINESKLLIQYQEGFEHQRLEGELSDFRFTKGTAFNRTRTVYLAIYQNQKLKMRQFENGEWNEDIMDTILESINKVQMHSKNNYS